MLNTFKTEDKSISSQQIQGLKLQEQLCRYEFESLSTLIATIRSSNLLYQKYAQFYPISSPTVFSAFEPVNNVIAALDKIFVPDDFKALDENTFKNFMAAYRQLRSSVNDFRSTLFNFLLVEYHQMIKLQTQLMDNQKSSAKTYQVTS